MSRDLFAKMRAAMEPEIRQLMKRMGLDADDPEVRREFTEIPRPAQVFLVERISGRWYAVVELHQDCKPNHIGCKVIDRFAPVDFGGFDTRQIAERELKAWLEVNHPHAVWYSKN